MNDKIIVKNIKSIQPKYKKEHEKYEYNKFEVTKRSDFSQVYICFYEIMPGKAAFPKHYHSSNTEAFYIISGNGKIETNEKTLEVTTGDIVVFPCGKEGTHKIVNSSDKDTLIYIDFDTTNSPDIITYVDSNKIGVIQHSISSDFYKKDSTVDYYDGE